MHVDLEGLFRPLVEASPEALLLIDHRDVVLYANPQAHALFGYSGGRLTRGDVPLSQLIPMLSFASDPAQQCGRLDAPSTAEPTTYQGRQTLQARRADGTAFAVELRWGGLTKPFDGLLGLVASAASDRERLINELTVARQQAEDANALKSRFLAAASHDLRQPLQSVLFINGALRRCSTSPEMQELLEQERRGLEGLSTLLNALLDIVRLESGTLQPTVSNFALAGLFEDLHRQFAESASQKGLQLRFEPIEATLHSDPVLLQQILQNLLGNAIRYTDTGHVTLRARIDATGALAIEIDDSGVGIAVEMRQRIFEDFYQISPAGPRHRGGSGLGLGIVRRLAQLLNLPLQLDSELGVGTTVTLAVPATTQAAPARGATVADTSLGTLVGRILLVEDDTAVRNALQQYLRLDGHEVVAIPTLSELERALPEWERPPDLIITDFHLGAAERGTDAITRVEAHFGIPTGAIVLTGDTSSLPERVLERHGIRLLNKPIAGHLLSSAVQESLAAQRKVRSAHDDREQ